jgi:glycosyltransferase involved in cell wall biosynthesis
MTVEPPAEERQALASREFADDSRVRVCFLAPNAYPLLTENSSVQFAGGAELQQVLIAKGLATRGYSVTMVCLDYGQPETCTIDGITVFRAFRPDAGIPMLRFFWPRLTALWRSMKRADADVYYQRAGSMLTGVMAHFCRYHGRKSIFAVAGQTKIRFRRDRWLFRYGIRHVNRIVVQSEEQARHVRDEFGRDSELIPNIQPASTHPAELSGKYVLWVGMIRQVKRPDLFLDLAEALPDREFAMVGGTSAGESALYEAVSARAAELPNLRFAGFVPYREVDPYFDKALLFVNTSDSEGFPNTFLQAWARGKATVSFIDSGARLDGEPVGVRVHTPAELRDTVALLTGDDTLRSKWERAGKAYADRHHAADRVLDKYESLLQSLLRDDGAVRA